MSQASELAPLFPSSNYEHSTWTRFRGQGHYYNRQRPHQALEMKVPADLYTRSTRPYNGLGQISYPLYDRTVTVTQCGRVCYNRQKINRSAASQLFGLRGYRRLGEVVENVRCSKGLGFNCIYIHYESRNLNQYKPIASLILKTADDENRHREFDLLLYRQYVGTSRNSNLVSPKPDNGPHSGLAWMVPPAFMLNRRSLGGMKKQ